MTRYEYFQETTESITDELWKILLDKHASQGWVLSSINHKDVYGAIHDNKAAGKIHDAKSRKQTRYIIVFKRAY